MKMQGNILAAITTVGLSAAFASAAISSAPIYQWNFDGGTGTPVTSGGAGGGILAPTGTTGATVTPNNTAPVFTGTGVSGLAGDNAYFNAATSYGTTDFSAANSTSTLTGASAPQAVNQITVTAWIKLPNGDINTGLGKVLFINSPGNQFGNPIAFALNTSAQTSAQAPTAGGGARLQANIANVNPNFVTALNGTTYQGNISAGQVDTSTSTTRTDWHFVAFTFDGTATNATGNLNFYSGTGLTGTVANIGTGYIAATIPDFSAASVAIGNNGGTLTAAQGRPIDGYVDDVRIYSGIGTLTDLQTIAGSAVPEPSMLALASLTGAAVLRRRRAH